MELLVLNLVGGNNGRLDIDVNAEVGSCDVEGVEKEVVYESVSWYGRSFNMVSKI